MKNMKRFSAPRAKRIDEDRLIEALHRQRMRAIAEFLREGWSPRQPIGNSNPLNLAGGVRVLRLLISGGADVNAAYGYIRPLVIYASAGNEEAVECLLAAGADPNAACRRLSLHDTPKGTTALMTAAGNGRLGVAKILLRAGADLNSLDEHGHNALFHALYWNRTQVAKALLGKGSRLTEDTLGGPVHHGNLQLVRLLIGKGAEVNCVLHAFESGCHFSDGETLLGCAVSNACLARKTSLFSYPLKIIDALLRAGANPNQPSQDAGRKRDPVSIATSWGQEQVFDMLKKGGARKSLREAFEGGWTLHGACFAGRTAVVKLLLKAGFDPSAPDKTGKMPMEYAAERGHSEIIKLLQRAGAGVGGGGMK